MTKRVWKPLDVGGHRLYEVKMMFPECPQNNVSFVVVADSPTQARKMIEEIDRDGIHSSEPFYLGMPLNILMPADWWKRKELNDALFYSSLFMKMMWQRFLFRLRRLL